MMNKDQFLSYLQTVGLNLNKLFIRTMKHNSSTHQSLSCGSEKKVSQIIRWLDWLLALNI